MKQLLTTGALALVLGLAALPAHAGGADDMLAKIVRGMQELPTDSSLQIYTRVDEGTKLACTKRLPDGGKVSQLFMIETYELARHRAAAVAVTCRDGTLTTQWLNEAELQEVAPKQH